MILLTPGLVLLIIQVNSIICIIILCYVTGSLTFYCEVGFPLYFTGEEMKLKERKVTNVTGMIH